jgi:hypothetical protein
MFPGIGSLILGAIFLLQSLKLTLAASIAPVPLNIEASLDTANLEASQGEDSLPDQAPNIESLSLSTNEVLNTESGPSADLAIALEEPSGLAYPVTDSVSIGVGYGFVEAENLIDITPAAGLVDIDHQSHHVMLRAEWHFGN